MTDQQRQRLLDDLTQVAHGGIADFAHTQTNEEFFRNHMPIPEHQRILRSDILLVLGGRGVGKSQLFQALSRLPDPSKLAVASRSPVDPDKATERVEYIVGFEKRGTGFPSAENLGLVLGEDHEQTPRLIWLGLLAGVLLNSKRHVDIVKQQLPENLSRHLQESLPYPNQWLSLIRKHIEEVTRALDNVERKLETDNASIIITYDELDVLAAKLTHVYPFVRELLALWLDRSRRWNRLRCKIFLRTDIFAAEALAFADSSKLGQRSLTLNWSHENLYWLLIKRLINGNEEKLWKTYLETSVGKNAWKQIEPWGIIPLTRSDHHRQIIRKMIGTYMGTDPTRGETYRWFFNHLQDSRGMIAPRSFLKLYENAAERQRREGQKLPSDYLLSPSQVQGALEDVSSDRIDELAEEYPWVRVLKKSLAGNTVPMARKEFAMLLKKTEWETGAQPRHTQPEQLVDDLLSLGILRETEDKRIHVPDIYLYGFGLKRKGGIRRPKP